METEDKIVRETPTKGILYYSDSMLDEDFAKMIRDQILKANLPVTSVTLKPLAFGKNIHMPLERGFPTMFKQILAGLEAMTEDIVYFCEHDVLYHPMHFDFIPPDPLTFYYNGNYWFLRQKDGFAIHYNVSPLSGLVVNRESAVKHFRERVALIEKEGFGKRMGFEPFGHRRIKWEFWCGFKNFMPEFPNIDITHGGNSSWKRWEQRHFVRKPTFWEESTIDNIPGWNNLRELLSGKK